MLLLDVNVLVNAFRAELPAHDATRHWLESQLAAGASLGCPDGMLCGFVRIVTQKPFNPPSKAGKALDFVDALKRSPAFRTIAPTPRQWDIFAKLCRQLDAGGNALQDLYWASFAIDLDCEFVTFDADFHRIPGLRRRSPLDAQARANPR